MSEPLKLIVIGCGSRGTGYSKFVEEYPERAKIVAVAEPREFYRNRIADKHNIPEEYRFRTWEDVAKLPKFADAVMICTPDALHEAPAVAFAKLGYNMLLEKPLAPTEEACRNIVAAVKKAGIIFAVCHVLRYTEYTRCLLNILASGKIGRLVSIQHLEPVGYWHQAHSFVRGNWRNEELSSCMLLQKCCHDLDWLRYVVNEHCSRVQSFGSLFHFKKENQPAGAADRCTECPKDIEANCPYSALKIYLRDRLDKGSSTWPVDVLDGNPTRENIMKALEEGPYGRCVYACDNDVVDNQVVNLQFDNGVSASMTMTAFTPHSGRLTRLFGTRGYIETDSNVFKMFDFETDQFTEIDSQKANDGGILSGHGGGDGGLMEAFVSALEHNDPSRILSGLDVSLESHLMVFAAERSRKTGTVQDIKVN